VALRCGAGLTRIHYFVCACGHKFIDHAEVEALCPFCMRKYEKDESGEWVCKRDGSKAQITKIYDTIKMKEVEI
jgi:hypothetical protein